MYSTNVGHEKMRQTRACTDEMAFLALYVRLLLDRALFKPIV